jgi:hypothetical protein
MFNAFYITLYEVSQHNRLMYFTNILFEAGFLPKGQEMEQIHQEKWHFFTQPSKCPEKRKKTNLQ